MLFLITIPDDSCIIYCSVRGTGVRAHETRATSAHVHAVGCAVAQQEQQHHTNKQVCKLRAECS